MERRLELHSIFKSILNNANVYFQPPMSTQMKYDAIRYSRKDIENVYANNGVYNQHDCYEVIAIYKKPDSDIPKKISRLPMCSFDRHYVADNLNHDVFTIYY